ncbi:AP2-like ethylene-responsive transcription factor AIL6 isoform X1 [Aristolochia californica]|uniref:AP2-like ethylene-responsive transcription factor AIL6 isoform X1 n=1 Tax=Aristolochia californica TaxID=171875 RepID=UPI0035D5E357
MAPANGWLSSCFTPSEVLRSRQSQVLPTRLMPLQIASDASQPYLFEVFNDNDWLDVKAPIFYTEEENEENKEGKEAGNPANLIPTVQQPIQKFEHFLLNQSSLQQPYSSRRTETQESSLSSVYEQDFTTAGQASCFKAFSAKSGSEIVDSSSVTGNTVPEGNITGYLQECGHGFPFTGRSSFSLPGPQFSQKGASAVGTVKSKKTSDTVLQRTSAFRGVTRHRWTGRFEAHLWDNSCRREGQSRKGRQVYLGGYDKEEKAARAYDLAALKYWGSSATTNFPISSYTKEIDEMKNMTKQEFVASLRRKSSGFSRGASVYRGVTRHHQQGRWQARIGRVAGNKDLYLGTFVTEEEAAEAYDIAAIKFRGVNAVTNFEMGRYDLEAIAASVLPIGSAAKRLKHQPQQQPQCSSAVDNVPASALLGLGLHDE